MLDEPVREGRIERIPGRYYRIVPPVVARMLRRSTPCGIPQHRRGVGDDLHLVPGEFLEDEAEGHVGRAVERPVRASGRQLDRRPSGVPDRDPPEVRRAAIAALGARGGERPSDKVIAEVDRRLNDRTDGEVAKILNEREYRTGGGLAFTPKLVSVVRRRYALKSRHRRLRDRELLQSDEIAGQLGVVADSTAHRGCKGGLLRGHVYWGAGYRLFEIPASPPTKQPGQ